MKIVAVTACPTGIAHTYMAAEALEAAAEEAGHEITVETQGSAGSTPLTAEQLAEADVAIFAADVEVRDKDRFAHLPQVAVGVKKAISGGDLLVAQAEEALKNHVPAPAGAPAAAPSGVKAPQGPGAASKVRAWLMTGVSHVIPFVAAGGLLIALGFALGGYQINLPDDSPLYEQILDGGFSAGSITAWGALAFGIGSAAFNFLVPVLAGFIAYAMADRPALVPGFVGGAIAVTTGAGFLGGLVAGFVAGGLVMWIKTWRVPRALAGIMPVLVIPLLSTAVVGLLMYVVVGRPIALITEGLTNWLNGLSGTNAVLLGLLLGLMMCFDMGGPVNKASYTFAVAGLSTGSARRPDDHGRGHGRRHGAAAGDGPRDRRPEVAVQRGRAGERPGRVAARRLVHLRGRDPVRRRRPVPRDPLDHGRRGRHRLAVDGPRRHPARPARRRLRGAADGQPARASSSRWSPGPWWPRPSSSPSRPSPAAVRPPRPPRAPSPPSATERETVTA